MQKKFYIFIKWAFAIVAYAFLAYKLFTFEHYGELWAGIKLFDIRQFTWLAAVFLLLTPNWMLEARKWQLLTKKTERISLKTSFKAVIAGVSTGFFTPNRIGEMAGRVLYLSSENRRKGVVLSLISGVTMTLTIFYTGIPALVAFLFFTDTSFIGNRLVYFSVAIFLTVLLLCIYFLLPKIGKKFAESTKFPKLKTFFSHLKDFKAKDLFSILCVALARYAVACVQMYCTLRFFGINIEFPYCVAAIFSNYLLITLTPTFSFSEGAVRGSYAALVFGAFGANPISCAFAGLCIWLINTMLPVLFGTFFILKTKKN
ncbi:MAG: flippase-like domain-containing protein [Paludibacter sp.]|nr:flippase-like domain-containing protein [Paludibacter sp.]